MKKKTVISLITLLLTVSSFSTVYAGVWERSYNQYTNKYYWKYKQDNGTYKMNGWQQIGDNWYYFSGGNAEADYIVDSNDGYSYYVDTNCKMVKGGFYTLAKNNGQSKVFTDSTGKIPTGFFMVDGTLCYIPEGYGIAKNMLTTYRAESRDKFMGNDGKEHTLHYIYDGGKVLELDGNPIKSDDKFYQLIKYLPKYDSKGNFLGAIQN